MNRQYFSKLTFSKLTVIAPPEAPRQFGQN